MSSSAHILRRSWEAFWFGPGSAANLGFCRVVCAAILIIHPRSLGSEKLHRALSEVWLPASFFKVFQVPLLPPPRVLEAIDVTYMAALVLALVGLLTRMSCAVGCVLGLYLLGLPQNLGKINHDSGVVPFLLLILAVARSGDAWSLDALIRRWRARRAGVRGAIPPVSIPLAEYQWPVRMVWLLTAWVFAAAAYSKLSASGLAWVTTDNMRNTLLMHAYLGGDASSVALWVSRHKWLCHLMAGAGLVFEAAVPLAMFSRRARLVIIPGLAMTLAGFLVLGFTPVPFFAMLAFWVPWDRVGAWIRSRLRRPADATAEAPTAPPKLAVGAA